METKRSRPRLALIVNLATLVVALAGYGIAFAQVHAYEADIIRHQFIISGFIPTPVIHLTPAQRQGTATAIATMTFVALIFAWAVAAVFPIVQ